MKQRIEKQQGKSVKPKVGSLKGTTKIKTINKIILFIVGSKIESLGTNLTEIKARLVY